MKKQFFAAAMVLALGAGFTACSSDELNTKDGVERIEKGTTYMSVSFALPTGMSTRAAADGQDKDDPDFNHVGKWEGQDKIEKVLVYVFDAADKLEVKQEYNGSDLAFTQNNNGSGKAVVTPNSAFKVLPGQKTVYVVLNPTNAAETLLPANVGTTTLAQFKAKYESAEFAFAKPTRRGDNTNPATSYVTTDETRAGEIAKVEGTGTSASDVILMTGEAASENIIDEVSATQAVSGQKNRVKLEVQRAVARVLVTTLKNDFDIEGVDPENPTAPGYTAATISELTYVVAQGEAKIFFKQNELAAETDGSKFTTPAFSVVNQNLDYWSTAGLNNYATVGENYDYSGLWKNTAAYPNIKGVKVPTRAKFENTKATELGLVTADLRDGLDGEFILPALHKYVQKDEADARKNTGYRKGNTPYILIRGLLKPKKYVKADGTLVTTPATEAKDWYLGANGFFYEDVACVQNPAKKGVKGQTAQLYKGGKVLYFLWLNPDDVVKAVNSPTLRNNIYHVQIAGVGKIGANWNPLIPFDPNDPSFPGHPGGGGTNPNDPSNPTFPKNPNNPDPRPDNPYEPKDPPVDPKDPLSFKETWMAVQVSILPWQVHSYSVVL